MTRKPLPKGLRFEVFKRDGFRCTYCGATPVLSVLRVDHVKPVVEGGTNAPENLVTACDSCNAGKSGTLLEKKKHPAGKVTEENRDHAEQIREWLALQREVTEAKDEVKDLICAEWEKRCQSTPRDLRARLPKMLAEFSVAQLMEAFDIVGTSGPRRYTDQVKYLYGILRRWREEGKAGSVPVPGPVAPAPTPPAAPPLSAHAKRCFAAIQRIHQKIASSSEAPPIEEQRCMLLNAFARAAWALPEDMEWYQGDASEYDTHTINGVVLEFSDRSVSVRDATGFNPYQEAWERLRDATNEANGPDQDEPPDVRLGNLNLFAQRLDVLLTMLTYTNPHEIRDHHALFGRHQDLFALWDLGDAPTPAKV